MALWPHLTVYFCFCLTPGSGNTVAIDLIVQHVHSQLEEVCPGSSPMNCSVLCFSVSQCSAGNKPTSPTAVQCPGGSKPCRDKASCLAPTPLLSGSGFSSSPPAAVAAAFPVQSSVFHFNAGCSPRVSKPKALPQVTHSLSHVLLHC